MNQIFLGKNMKKMSKSMKTNLEQHPQTDVHEHTHVCASEREREREREKERVDLQCNGKHNVTYAFTCCWKLHPRLLV